MSATAVMTLAEFDTWTDTHDGRWELVGGVPVMVPPESHDSIDAALGLNDHLRGHGLSRRDWFIGTQASLILARDPATMRVPDVLVSRRAHGTTGLPATIATTVLVVEVLSTSTASVDLHDKRGEYAAAGIPNYLVIDVRGPAPTLRLFDRSLTVATPTPRPPTKSPCTSATTRSTSAPPTSCSDLEEKEERHEHPGPVRPRVTAEQVALVAEVVSPSSIERDWVTKRAEYARAGIPAYLVIQTSDDLTD